MIGNAITAETADWLAAVDDSSARLRDLVGDMGDADLGAPSYAKGWSVAQVLSHLGSAAEIGTVLLRRGLDGDDSAPTPADTGPVWDRWNAMSSPDQRAQWVDADATHRETLRAAADLPVRVPYFAGLLTVRDYAGYRLSEQSVHGWDVAVATDPGAAIAPAEVSLLWQRLDLVATRFRAPDVLARLSPSQLEVRTTSPDGVYCLTLGAELHLLPCEPAEPSATLRGSSEAVLRLVYGRLRDVDGVTADGSVTLHDAQALFPGY
ncbi:maleylpyruvate isomerase family mycothiol-dependent enzyme [Mycolicibacterium sp. P1-18]|uniref:maleylpyruvate isomerase family mycothiol-dependent enzyme n=1 Tax=Mycolicibacterium sp. P1-18 TaxID=2024615 RepID=UPI0011F273A5|nr:maleylpyruvate isomerase family mycothiol-dependent enzyme [Mycolicibacterium sp. P1-18]KAA0099571.1 maleylpyruvate isomerase family mycothiol-dependent enzyme [Mycolicibacterium sp. P1-18]